MRKLITLLLLSLLICGSFLHRDTVAAPLQSGITLVAQTSNTGEGTTINVPIPSDNDNRLMIACIDYSFDFSLNPTLTIGEGWTALPRLGFSGQIMAIYYRIGNPNFQETWSSSEFLDKFSVWVGVYSGLNLTTPINASQGAATSQLSSQHFAPSVTTTVANCKIVAFWASGDTGCVLSSPATMDFQFSVPGSSAATALTVADVTQPSAGSSGTKAATSNFSNTGLNYTLALAPAQAGGAGNAPRRAIWMQ